MSLIFDAAKVTGVTSNLAKGKISLTFKVSLEEQWKAEQLAEYVAKDAGTLVLEVSPRQMQLRDAAPAVTGVASEETVKELQGGEQGTD